MGPELMDESASENVVISLNVQAELLDESAAIPLVEGGKGRRCLSFSCFASPAASEPRHNSHLRSMVLLRAVPVPGPPRATSLQTSHDLEWQRGALAHGE